MSVATIDIAHFRQNLKRRCSEHGSIQKLANAAGITRVYLSEIINGHKSPSLDVAIDIARALGEDINSLTSIPPRDPGKPKKNLRKVS